MPDREGLPHALPPRLLYPCPGMGPGMARLSCPRKMGWARVRVLLAIARVASMRPAGPGPVCGTPIVGT